eukprot:TRINITY_DN15531_c0_g1_i25.p2 TRINITY_DN15531_c0_g1~~TRINITY_DN15531_c0_g1_i25.p2  ORF type:complete len:143 (+),score=41.61 TRINITY_DN15531_c0_g1_i25:197-625(+)
MCQLQIDQVLVMLLDHANSEVLYSVCGVLTNIAADPRHKNALAKMDGVSRMIKLIGRSCSSEIPLAVIACRALFNFCLENAGEEVCMSKAETGALHELLAQVLETEEQSTHPQWDELTEVAFKLLEHLEAEEEESQETQEAD